VVVAKVCQGKIYELYVNLNTRFKFNALDVYKSLLCVKHESIVMCLMINLNMSVEHLTFDVN